MRRHGCTTALVVAALGSVGLFGPACGDSGGFELTDDAQLQVTPSSVTFGDVQRGEQVQRTVRIQHVGTAGTARLRDVELVTDSADLSVGRIEQRTFGPGEAARIQLLYRSTDDARDEGELRVATNVGASPELTIPVQTPGQRGDLRLSRSSLDFGIVQAGEPAERTTTVRNVGSAPATLTEVVMQNDPDGDFEGILPASSSARRLEPNQTAPLTFRYAPSGRDDDDAVASIRTERDDVRATVTLRGEEETPELVADPPTVQLGWIEPGASELATVTLRNEGNTTLVLQSFELVDARSSLGLVGRQSAPLELPPGEQTSVDVLFEPEQEIPMGGEPLGTVRVGSNDAANDPLDVPVHGAAGTPSIFVIPENIVDFAFVAEGFVAERRVEVRNEGSSTVTIESGELSDATTEEFDFPGASKLPVELAPGGSTELTVTFENTGGTEGQESAQLGLETTDPLVPEYPLDVVARRAEIPTCKPEFNPELVDVGSFEPGSVGTGTIRVVNYGAGRCIYKRHDLVGCHEEEIGVRTRFDCAPSPPPPFEILAEPETGTELGPGESLPLEVRFEAPPIEEESVGRVDYFARLTVDMHDPNRDSFAIVAPEGGWMSGINLRATTAHPVLAIEPDELEFGRVRTGCASRERAITVENLGPMEATVTDVTREGCPGEIQMPNLPELPFQVEGYGTRELAVSYTPVDAGEDACSITFETNANNLPEKTIPLTGEGLDVDHRVDTFEQAPHDQVDVLFVVDDSPSMTDEQQLLEQTLPQLVEAATEWGQGYHIGVTTTDTEQVNGKLQGQPAYGIPSDPVEAVADNLIVGIDGHFEERGLEGAWQALSGANVTDTDIDCDGSVNSCPEGLRCVEGQCRGWNWGFLREDAQLVVVFVSDEEDQSPESVDWYTSHFAGLKGPKAEVGVKLHAIITTQQGCPAGFGTIGTRYRQAVETFGGHVSSICASDFSDEFDEIADKTFGLREQFHPSLPPEPETLEVRVKGGNGIEKGCERGEDWVWNETLEAVVFEEGTSCYPDLGDQVELEYDVQCNPAP